MPTKTHFGIPSGSSVLFEVQRMRKSSENCLRPTMPFASNLSVLLGFLAQQRNQAKVAMPAKKCWLDPHHNFFNQNHNHHHQYQEYLRYMASHRIVSHYITLHSIICILRDAKLVKLIGNKQTKQNKHICGIVPTTSTTEAAHKSAHAGSRN